jgi:hypothetical protein
LAADRIYNQETSVLFDQATAQDVVTLLPVAPLLAFLAVSARRGSLSAFLCLPGLLAFTVYNYAIYAFSIHFGPLLLVWVAILGLSIFALVGALATADMPAIKQRFAGRAMPRPAWFLIVVAVLFVLLWLSEIVPSLLAGDPRAALATGTSRPTRCTYWTWPSSYPPPSPAASCSCAAGRWGTPPPPASWSGSR